MEKGPRDALSNDRPALEECFRVLANDRASADIMLVANPLNSSEEVTFYAHRAILACRSAYFRALFSSEFRERGQAAIHVQGMTADQLRALLCFVYMDELPAEDVDFAMEMVPLADCYSVLELKRLCERTLIGNLNIDTAASVFALADRYSCTRLRRHSLLFMTDPRHFHYVMKTDGFAELDKGLILEILHSHKAASAPPPAPPAEPLPGSAATGHKGGQTSSTREHRHVRKTTSMGGTARLVHGAVSGDQARGCAGSPCQPGAAAMVTPGGSCRSSPRVAHSRAAAVELSGASLAHGSAASSITKDREFPMLVEHIDPEVEELEMQSASSRNSSREPCILHETLP